MGFAYYFRLIPTPVDFGCFSQSLSTRSAFSERVCFEIPRPSILKKHADKDCLVAAPKGDPLGPRAQMHLRLKGFTLLSSTHAPYP